LTEQTEENKTELNLPGENHREDKHVEKDGFAKLSCAYPERTANMRGESGPFADSEHKPEIAEERPRFCTLQAQTGFVPNS
jgi:hypothetical protein